jgi:hypothetical protein
VVVTTAAVPAVVAGALVPGAVFDKAWMGGASSTNGRAVTSSSMGPPLAGAARRLVDASLVRAGSQNGSGSGVSSEVGCGVLAAAAKRLKKAWLDAAPDGS